MKLSVKEHKYLKVHETAANNFYGIGGKFCKAKFKNLLISSVLKTSSILKFYNLF